MHRVQRCNLLLLMFHDLYVSDIIMSCAKTAEPVQMPFAFWTPVGSRNHVLDEGPDLLRRKGNFCDAANSVTTRSAGFGAVSRHHSV